MKQLLLTALLLPLLFTLKAQQVADLEENTPYTYNGMEYSYYITNEGNKEVKGEDYSRYELNLTVTNKSGCIKLFPLRFNNSGQLTETNASVVAEFNCKNATGKRLTSKSGKLEATPWYTQVKVDQQSSSAIVNALVGYAVRNGHTLTRRIIVIVPKGERPKVNCRIIYIPDMM